MKFNELTVAKQTKPTRPGRGISAGRGKTAGRGTKGQGSRKSPTKYGFEGGQMPLHMRLPKLRGFKSHRSTPEVIYTGQLDGLKAATVDTKVLSEAGMISSQYVPVKLILNGELKSKKTVKLQSVSANALAAVEKAGGSFEKTARIARPAKKTDKKAA